MTGAGTEIPRRSARGWWAILLLDLALCAVLGSRHSIGSAPLLFAVGQVCLLASLWPLIRAFPFERRPTPVLLGIALIARLLFLPMAPSDDVHRYLWEGRVLNAGYDPYLLPPDAPPLESLRDAHWDGINHKNMTAIYPPGALMFFQAITRVAQSPGSIKIVIAIVDLVSVVLLLALLRSHRRRTAWSLVYILNPVVLCAFAGEGHLDALLILGVLATLLLYEKGWFKGMFVAMAVAIHAKYVAVLILPFLVTRKTLRSAWVLPLAGLLPLIPFLPAAGLFTSLTQFSAEMHYNGSVHALLGALLEDFPLASRLCAVLLLGVVGIARLLTPRPLEGAALVFSALLLLSPNVHYWYVAWVIPLLCFYPYPAMLLLCGTLVFTFRTLGVQFSANVWEEYPVMSVLEYAPVYAVLLWTACRLRIPHPLADASPRPRLGTISVVVPVLNEAPHLPAFLAQLQAEQPHEIILADGGSTDDTIPRAREAGVHVVSAPPGRGHQIAAAIDASSGDAVFVAHADMRLEPGVLHRVLKALNRSGQIGGCVGCRFEGRHPFLSLISLLNAARARWGGISFGDQGQFARRDALELDLAGFPDQPLMEDVEFSLRLKSHERPLYLGGGIVVSPRRWHSSRMLGNALLVIKLVASYTWQRWRTGSAPDVTPFYQAYYGRAPKGNDE